MMMKHIATTLALAGALCAEEILPEDSLSLQVFASLLKEYPGNIAYSPLSLESALETLREYSGGETRAELDKLPYAAFNCPQFDIDVKQASGLFVDKNMPLQPGVQGAVSLDFTQAQQAADTINSWCSEHTEGRISQIVQAANISPLTAFIATDAIYMKADWKYPFRKNASFEGEFHTADGKTVPVNMMRNTANYNVYKGEDWVAVALPYASTKPMGNTVYFVAVCPTENAREFAGKLSYAQYREILGHLEGNDVKTQLIMPSFTVEGDAMCLNSALKAAGLNRIFTDADFSRLTTSKKPLFLEKILQKCYVKVDEQGTEAAAVTATFVSYRAMTRTVMLDRPFIWFITDGFDGWTAPLFMGIYEQP